MTIVIENDRVRYEISDLAENLRFIDKATGADHLQPDLTSAFAHVKKGGRRLDATSITHSDGQMTACFGASGVTVNVKVDIQADYLTFEVVGVEGDGVEELCFLNIPLGVQAREEFTITAMALNLRTNVPGIPGGPNALPLATCYPRFGFAGAKAALLAGPQGDLRRIMQQVVDSSQDLPRSPIGGPRALDSEGNRGSYLFNFGDLSEDTVEDWIKLAKSLGITQIDFHGGSSFRFGDCRPDPNTYPEGLASLRSVIDRLHAAGILAGLHTYAFFIDKTCPWITPIPDQRLAKDATFTLSEPLGPRARRVTVAESTQEMSTTTGFFVRNSVTLQIDDELIVYGGISKEPPYSFTDCQRGTHGTQPSSHPEGSRVHHLKECFGLFVPDGDSTLYAEVAARTAAAFNGAGFDMIYLDALDGEDVVGGRENGWHYGSKFVFEIWKHLKKPAIVEMSTFHHHLWYVRSRMGAWDHPSRSHKRFVDIHCAANEGNKSIFLPSHLGWWAFKTWAGPQVEPTFADDIEYLCCKCIGHDVGLSVMGIDPEEVSEVPALGRLGQIVGRYEHLRLADHFGQGIKARLRRPGDEFTLFQDPPGSWGLKPAQYSRHKVVDSADWASRWTVSNRFGRQIPSIRIEALASAGGYEAPENLTLADFTEEWEQTSASSSIKTGIATSTGVKEGMTGGSYEAVNATNRRKGAWSKAMKTFSPPVDLRGHQALGLWVKGDGQREVLNLQVRSPVHVSHAVGDHYVVVDFVGWHYIELIEPEGERYDLYQWPYGSPYAIYREAVDYGQIESLSLWYNNLPAGGKVTCRMGPIKALPLKEARIVSPAITIGGRTMTFPVEMTTGDYLEFDETKGCILYGPKGQVIREVEPEGKAFVMERGPNQVTFSSDSPEGPTPRVAVTLATTGRPLRDLQSAEGR
jgi:hypothetical protein